jgi:hypothetical protein
VIDPYDFVRAVTITLASVWTVMGLLRALRFVHRWERRLAILGLSRSWLRRQVGVVLLRATVLDPVNLALMVLLFGIWTIRAVV